MKKILFLDTNHPVMIETLRSNGFVCEEDYHSSAEEIKKKIADYHGLVIRSRFKITKDILDHCQSLEVIGRAGAGMENIDVNYAVSKGIECVHAPEGNRVAVGEQALGMLLSLMNNLRVADREVRSGVWKREENRGTELTGKKVGIIGFGNMGTAFAKVLQGFDVDILVYDKYKTGISGANIRQVELSELQKESDVVSFHVPLTEETHYMANDEFFSSFVKPIWFINTSRGKVVKTAALTEALKKGAVKGAALDVLEYESVSFENLDATSLPEPFQYLIAADNVILSPHIAGWTFESHKKIGSVLAEKITAVLRKK